MRRLMMELRQEDPELYINLTTGSWPSPFWLRYADSLWRQGEDMGLAGKGSRQQQVAELPGSGDLSQHRLQGPPVSTQRPDDAGRVLFAAGPAGDPTFDSAGFKDDVRAFFASGTSLQELYIQPGKLTARRLVRAGRGRKMVAGQRRRAGRHPLDRRRPGEGEVYGYASWSPRKGIVMLRNPDDRQREFSLDVGAAFELPAGATTRFTLRSRVGRGRKKSPRSPPRPANLSW